MSVPWWKSALVVLSLAGCCLSVSDGSNNGSGGSSTGGACLAIVPPPPDAGPMWTFNENPFALSIPSTTLFTFASASDVAPPETILAEFVPSPAAVACLVVAEKNDLTVTCGSGDAGVEGGVLSISSNEAGTKIVVQSILADGGEPICTWLGDPCGAHGDCCFGLSCQAVDGGCMCAYAWPNCYPWESACRCALNCDGGVCAEDDAGAMFCPL